MTSDNRDILPFGPAWERPLTADALAGMLDMEPALLPGLPEAVACVRGIRLYAAGDACARALWQGDEGGSLSSSVCALGAFDGMHAGHRSLVDATVEEARVAGVPSLAVTFDPDPADVLAGLRPSSQLLPVADRVRVLLALGLDGVLVVPFTPELAATSHADFMASVLVPAAHPVSVHVGSDFRMGRGGAGDVTALAEVGTRIGMSVRPHDLVRSLGETVSATRVRSLVRSGDVEAASRLLCRYHAVSGTVVHGRGEGTAFGFPTANVECAVEACLPAEGVYAAVALVDGHAWPTAVNVGKPRTFGGERGGLAGRDRRPRRRRAGCRLRLPGRIAVISDEDKERVRQATDIVALVSETVVLRPRGGNDFWGCCPFHHEKSPSFHVTPSTGLWHCFGCHAGGDVFDYVMRREGLDFLDAVRYLAERAHIDIDEGGPAGRRGPKRTRVIDALEAAQEAFSLRLMRGRGAGADEARRYFASRGFNSGICARWHLGYADPLVSLGRELQQRGFTRDELIAADLASNRGGRLRDQFYNRVMFPIHDEQGRCIGFGGRVMGDAKPKYLNTRETSVFHKSKHLFAFDYAKESITAKGYAIVCEGYMDVISMHEAGFTNAVAALGTALSLDHVKTLSRFAKTIVCMFDGDAAGQHAAEASLRYIESTTAALSCVVLPDNQDPDEFLKAHGADAMADQLRHARPLLDFVLDKKLDGYDLSSPGLRLRALEEIARLLAPLKHSYLLDSYAQQVAGRLGAEASVVKERIRSAPIERVEEEREPVLRDGSGRGRAQGLGGAPQSAAQSSKAGPYEDMPPYDDVPPDYDGGYADEGYDAGPVGASGGGALAQEAPASLAALSPEERTQLTAERNLLTMLADHPDLFRPYADRIATFTWADARHQTIAWAILATPEGTSPADAVVAASRACTDAPRILPSGAFAATSSWDAEKNVEFVVNEAEIRSIDRRVATLTARLQASGSDADSLDVLRELDDLRKRRRELRAAQPLE